MMQTVTSRMPGFSKLSVSERAQKTAEFAGLDSQDAEALERMMRRTDTPELQIAPNFRINGKEYVVPMITEEASVVPAASNGARIVWNNGGFRARYTGSKMDGEIQLVEVKDMNGVEERILASKNALIDQANTLSRHIVAEDLSVEMVPNRRGGMMTVEFKFDTGDAMGANRINGMLQLVTPDISALLNGDGFVNTRILSNFSPERLVIVEATVRCEDIGGVLAAKRIEYVSELGRYSIKRATTDNKGIMNGAEGVLRATNNDTRAQEIGSGAYASYRHQYRSLSEWKVNSKAELVGRLTMPAQFGIIGGAIGLSEESRLSKKILSRNNPDSLRMPEFAAIVGAVSLANNLTALWKQSSEEGINAGHMKEFRRQQEKFGGTET